MAACNRSFQCLCCQVQPIPQPHAPAAIVLWCKQTTSSSIVCPAMHTFKKTVCDNTQSEIFKVKAKLCQQITLEHMYAACTCISDPHARPAWAHKTHMLNRVHVERGLSICEYNQMEPVSFMLSTLVSKIGPKQLVMTTSQRIYRCQCLNTGSAA